MKQKETDLSEALMKRSTEIKIIEKILEAHYVLAYRIVTSILELIFVFFLFFFNSHCRLRFVFVK